MTDDAVEALLLRWWNFTTNGVLGQLTSVTSEASSQTNFRSVSEEVSPWEAAFVRAFQDLDGQDTELSRISSDAVQTARPTLLDSWLEGLLNKHFLGDFEDELRNPSRLFTATFNSGKTRQGSLPSLVALRFASIVLQRPNPLFFWLNVAEDEPSATGSRTYLDPQWLLPTTSGLMARAQLVHTDGNFLVDPAWAFTAGSYLPDLAGRFQIGSRQPIRSPDADADAGAVESRGKLFLDELVSGIRHRTLSDSAFPRIIGMGSAFLVKKLLSPKFTFGTRRYQILERLIGLRSSAGLIGRPRYKQLRRLVFSNMSRERVR
jgi:hypothetical protein